MGVWGPYPEQSDGAGNMIDRIEFILHGTYYEGDLLGNWRNKITDLYVDVTNEFDSDIIKDALKTIEDATTKIVFKVIEYFFKESMRDKEYYEFVGLIRHLVIEENVSIPREIYIKCLIMLTLAIEYEEECSVEWDDDENAKEVKEEIKQWLKDQLNDTHYTSDLFMTLTRLKYINNEELPSVEFYDKLESHHFLTLYPVHM